LWRQEPPCNFKIPRLIPYNLAVIETLQNGTPWYGNSQNIQLLPGDTQLRSEHTALHFVLSSRGDLFSQEHGNSFKMISCFVIDRSFSFSKLCLQLYFGFIVCVFRDDKSRSDLIDDNSISLDQDDYIHKINNEQGHNAEYQWV
jgi:hypothetical protein